MHLALTSNAELVRDGKQIFLHFLGTHYSWDEVVPTTIYDSTETFTGTRHRVTAAEFVIECMTKLHRPGEPWPELAASFLLLRGGGGNLVNPHGSLLR